jgi:signal transduction histidine kinase
VSKSAIEQIMLFAEHSGVDLELTGESTVTGDFYQLERAIINILENAVKFSPSGTRVQIEISQSDHMVLWKCIDSGSGIAAEERQKIFEPFYRGTGAAEIAGSGLGLFIAKRIVERHGGRIHAEENKPNGLAIVLQFPV